MNTNGLTQRSRPSQFGFVPITDRDLDRVRAYAEEVFECGQYSVHGLTHWRRVETMALDLGRETGADRTVVRLFALLHDCCRKNDGADPDHGPRAADMLAKLVGNILSIDADRLCLLEQAIRYHTAGHTSDDPTIGTCWDADRLDLGRVGKRPDEKYMSTEPGKRRARLR